MKKLVILTFIGLLGILPLWGCGAGSIPDPQGYVNDFANLISDGIEQSLEATLSRFAADTTNEIAVVTVKTLGGQTIEDYTIKLAEKWGVGGKQKDNGLVILVAEKEREVRIEVGYGLEPDVTDALAKIIIENEMLPYFKDGDYDAGIQAGVDAVMMAIAGIYSPDTNTGELYNLEFLSGIPIWVWALLLFFGISVFSVIVAIIGQIGRTHGSRYTTTKQNNTPWFGGGFGGGGGGFSGGSFGGGGASGRW